MAFNFRLQKILDIKEKEEDDRKNAASIANKKVEIANMELGDLLEEYKLKGQERVLKISDGSQLSEVLEINGYIDYLGKAIDKKKIEIKKLEQEADERKDEYLESRKTRKTYDNLKEKTYQRFLQEEQKEEAKVIDQIVSYNYTKKIK